MKPWKKPVKSNQIKIYVSKKVYNQSGHRNIMLLMFHLRKETCVSIGKLVVACYPCVV